MVSEEESSDVYVKMEKCSHEVFIEEICENCEQHIDTICSFKLGYIHKDYTVSTEERDRLRFFCLKKMMEKKKLYLILDLDHTLVHSVRTNQLSSDELLIETDSMQDIANGCLFKLELVEMVTKLRPFVRTFLKEASDLYEMYIYTRGNLAYAYNIVKLLDPENKYFGARVITRDACGEEHGKSLDRVLAAENAVVILDDLQAAWTKHLQNLILIKKFFYFEFGNNGVTSPAALKEESKTDLGLVAVLNLLQQIHQGFFAGDADADFKGRDVRQVMNRLREEICCPERRVKQKRIQAEEFIPL
ncbi:Rna polymerase ii c-terminal domain phosphatase-like [Thalictrum thalictroides]|uniref:RNA polymerase II C-terminal domain phosphatase-like n=1 Tax=Thalictrum thalictroides TaxID=46969 RepID=A0A7J6VR50_THATH|nr:Rna polymerase ii c-terminal domain phosphatase-like [Thalictrum thalictroides]